MHEARINNTIVRYASEWDELTRRELEIITGLAMTMKSGTDLQLPLFFHMTGIQIQKIKPSYNPEDDSEMLYPVKLKDSSTTFLSSLQISELVSGLDFILHKTENEDGTISPSIDSHLTKNLIPSFKVGPVTYYGPADKLFNLNFSEYIHAETNLARFHQTKELKFLDRLIAILYRPEDENYDPESTHYKGDRREPFNDHHIDSRAGKISKLNHNVKMCIYLFYLGCQWWILQQFPHVFSHKGNSQDDNLGFLGLVDVLTDGDVTKTNQIRMSYLMDVLIHLERTMIENEKIQEELNKK